MGSFLSKKKKKRDQDITDQDRAILSLKNQRIKLEKERKRLEALIDNNVIVIRTLVAQKKRDRALLAMKKKRLREDQMKQLTDWLINVEGLLGNIEMARQQNRLVDALKQGADALKEIQKEVSVHDVEKLMEDSAEARQYQAEIEQIFSGGLMDGVDDDLLNELKELEDDILQGEMADLPPVPSVAEDLPPVPTTKLPEDISSVLTPKQTDSSEPLEDQSKKIQMETPLTA